MERELATAIAAYRRGDYVRAEGLLQSYRAPAGLNGRMARHYLGLSRRALGIEALRAGQFAQARRRLEQAQELLGPDAALAACLLAACAGADAAACLRLADALAQACPGDARARLLHAQAQWRGGLREPAVMTLTQALRDLGDHADLHLGLGLFLSAAEDYAGAERHLQQAVLCEPARADGHYYLGLARAALGDAAGAAASLEICCQLQPANLPALWQLALAAEACRQAGRRLVLKLPPPTAPPASESQLDRLAAYAAAQPEFVEACLHDSDDEPRELRLLLAAVLERALQRNPRYADLHYLAGRALRPLGRLDEARRHLRQAIELNPTYRKALIELGSLEAEAGQSRPAARRLLAALRAGADWPDVHAALGDALRQAGKTRAARRHYGRALALNRAYEPARRGLSALAA